MFIFTTDTIFKIFEVLMPEHMEVFNKIRVEISKNKIGLELSDSVKNYFNGATRFVMKSYDMLKVA